MKLFRNGVIIGFAAGYVLGAKAGRGRYEQIRNTWHAATRSTAVRQLGDVASETIQSVEQRLMSTLRNGDEKVPDAAAYGDPGAAARP